MMSLDILMGIWSDVVCAGYASRSEAVQVSFNGDEMQHPFTYLDVNGAGL